MAPLLTLLPLRSVRQTVWLWVALSLLLSNSANAEQKFGGHIKYQLSHSDYALDDVQTLFAGDTLTDRESDGRLTYELQNEGWQVLLHGEGLFVAGDRITGNSPVDSSGSYFSSTRLPDDDTRLFDFTREFSGNRLEGVLRLDRAAIGYSTESLVIRVGRQAMSWGNGLVFQVLDVFNPFAPTAIDKDYKSGDDLLFGQWLFSGGEDAQILVVPRRNTETHAIEHNSTSYASKFRGRVAEIDVVLLTAQHYDEPFLGLGATKDLFGAVIRCDGAVIDPNGLGPRAMMLLNIDRSWEFAEKNWYGFLEYFHSGFGLEEQDYATPSPALQERIERGELYTIGKNYLAGGVKLEISPLVNLLPSLIYNLGDQSAVLQSRIELNVLQDVTALVGINTAFGPKGSEFGGVQLSQLEDRAAGLGTQAYLRVSYYF